MYPISYVVDADAKHPELFGIHIPLLLYRLNPMVRLVEVFRTRSTTSASRRGSIVYLVRRSAATLAFGLWTFRRLEGRLAEEL